MTAEFTIAVHALVYLQHKKSVVSSTELADNICTNPVRVRKVLSMLSKAELVRSHRGQGTGYELTADASQITLAQVLAALHEQAVSCSWHSGNIDRECLISSGMGKIMDDIYSNLNSCCTAYLNTLTVDSIQKIIFKKEHQNEI